MKRIHIFLGIIILLLILIIGTSLLIYLDFIDLTSYVVVSLTNFGIYIGILLFYLKMRYRKEKVNKKKLDLIIINWIIIDYN